jgi:hypothetical protein
MGGETGGDIEDSSMTKNELNAIASSLACDQAARTLAWGSRKSGIVKEVHAKVAVWRMNVI